MGTLKGMTRADARTEAARWLERLGLADARRHGKSSSSRKATSRRCRWRRRSSPRPDIVILDEPLSGLDPVSARLVIGVIRDCAAAGQTVAAVDAPDGNGRVAVHARVDDRARTRRARRRAARDQAAVLDQRHPRAVDRRLPIVPARRADRRPRVGRRVRRRPPAAAGGQRRLPALAGRRPARSVERFERLSTPLEEIFVRVATENAVEVDMNKALAHRAVGVPGHRHAAARTSSPSSRCRCCSASSARSRSSRRAPRRRRRRDLPVALVDPAGDRRPRAGGAARRRARQARTPAIAAAN